MKNLFKVLASKLRTPYISMPLLMVAIVLSWVHFVNAKDTLEYDFAQGKNNLIANYSFEDWTDEKLKDWTIDAFGQNTYEVSRKQGLVNGYGLDVKISEYKNGSIFIKSPQVQIEGGKSYLFKSFYLTDAKLDVMVEITNSKNEKRIEMLRHYPDYDYPLSTLGSAFSTKNDDTFVRTLVSVHGKGFIQLDNAYLVEASPQASPKSPISQDMLLNSTYSFEPDESFVANANETAGIRSINIEKVGLGNLAWKPSILTAKSSELYSYNFSYISNEEVEIGADFLFEDGHYEYHVLQLLYPVGDYVEVSTEIEIPSGAIAVQPSVQIAKVGNLQVKNQTMFKLKNPASFDKPRISITFDDGWETSYSNGASLLEEQGFKGTFYINPGYLDSKHYMKKDNVFDLLRRGHQIGSHTETHIDITSFSQKNIIKELDKANKEIRKYGVNEIDFASPYGKYDDSTLGLVMERQATHRGTEAGINTKQSYDKANLKALFVRKETTDQEIKDYINRAKTTNGWLILIYHEIESNDSLFAIDKETLKRHLKIVKESGIEVQTVRQSVEQTSSQL